MTLPSQSQIGRWRWAVGLAALLVAFVLLDQTMPLAGQWTFLTLSVSIGLLHGALDAQLLWQRSGRLGLAIAWGLAYLICVLALGWMLAGMPSLALAALVLMSVWHFGEAYGRWDDVQHPAGQLLTRVVVGGASVLLPVFMSPLGLADLALPVESQAVLRWLASAWLSLAAVWLLTLGVRHWRVLRYAWAELLGVAVFNLLLSPLMAFAIYFGLYHSPVHIWRVWRARPISGKAATWALVAAALIMVLTVVLGAVLWHWTGVSINAGQLAPALNWLIIALAALTLPHLVLIGLCSRFLTLGKRRTNRRSDV